MQARTNTAYWAAGHCALAAQLEVPIARVTIVPSARALGYVACEPDDRFMHTRDELFNRLVMVVSGRAVHTEFGLPDSESLIADLQRASELAERMEGFGMGDARALVDEAKQRAGELVKANRAKIEALKATLLTEGTLSGEQVAGVLASVVH